MTADAVVAMTAARGRHAPGPEVRLPMQRDRLLRAAVPVTDRLILGLIPPDE